ncbi:MAG: riboflavin synthase [Elusimicrobiales bacterium]|nr:riboflavin synthase [Elusimicrobiales bacterium]
MFSGIIEKIAKVKKITSSNLSVENKFQDGLLKGDSISVNGICLTLTNFDNHTLVFDISPQTLKVTNLKFLKLGDEVNLERALKVGDRLGGHFLTGHIDEVGHLEKIEKNDNFYFLVFRISSTKYLVEKCSVGVNGISLTAFDIKNFSFKVAIIPHTYNNTNLKYLKINSYVNIEYDILLKTTLKNDNRITYDFLKQNGFI